MLPETIGTFMRQPIFHCTSPIFVRPINLRLSHSASPDQGLETKQMGGKKKKIVSLLGLPVVQIEGSERFEPNFIGWSRRPWCFKKQSPQEQGFYYHNKKAWMTMELFKEWGICSHDIIIHLCSHRWLKKLDLHIWKQQHCICLFIDNFSAHSTASYQPTNVQVEFFEPNMILFVQAAMWLNASRPFIGIIFVHLP